MNQSPDGYVDHQKLGPPAPSAFRHFVEHVRGLTGCIYGRGLYEIMRYWDEDLPDWDVEDRDFAAAWRSKPKWVVSRSLKTVGPNATLVGEDFEAVIRRLVHQWRVKSPMAAVRDAASYPISDGGSKPSRVYTPRCHERTTQ